MRLSLVVVALTQALAITAAPTKLSARVAYVPDDDLPAKYLADYGTYGDPNVGGQTKNIEKKEASPDPPITVISDHYLACYSDYGPGPYTDDRKDIIKRCAKERIKRDPQYTNYSDVYLACYIEYGTYEGNHDKANIEKRCGKFKK